MELDHVVSFGEVLDLAVRFHTVAVVLEGVASRSAFHDTRVHDRVELVVASTPDQGVRVVVAAAPQGVFAGATVQNIALRVVRAVQQVVVRGADNVFDSDQDVTFGMPAAADDQVRVVQEDGHALWRV